MSSEELNKDEIQPRKTVAVLKQPGKPRLWSMALDTWQLVAAIMGLLGAFYLTADKMMELFAKPRVEVWTREQMIPLTQAISKLPEDYATRREFAAHILGEDEANTELKQVMEKVNERVEYLYRNEIRKAREVTVGATPNGRGGGGGGGKR